MTLTAGVVAVQGDVSEHATAIEHAAERRDRAVDVVTIRKSGIVPDCDLLALPGGESTAISQLLQREGIAPEIREHVGAGKPVLATCAGLIVAARQSHDDRIDHLGILDATVDRNAFGRQVDSFEKGLDVDGLNDPFPAVFIRAPAVTSVGEGVSVLATQDGANVAAWDPPVLATAFHPELTDDSRIHDLALFGDAPPER